MGSQSHPRYQHEGRSGLRITKPDAAAHLKLLLFSPPGHGKTGFLGTMEDDPRTSPALILDFEGGVTTLVGRDIDIATVRDWTDFNEAYALLSDPDTEYKAVGVDSISETQTGGLLKLLEERSPEGKRPTDDTLTQGDWGTILVQMRRFVRHFKDLPMTVAMTALAGEDLDKVEGRVKVPLLQGSFQNEAPGIFDVVAYLAKSETDEGEAERLMLLHGHPGFRVKARAPMGVSVPQDIVDPTMTKLLDALGYGTVGSKKNAGGKRRLQLPADAGEGDS